MPNLPPILTSNSAYSAFQDCPRKRWWGYEAISQYKGHFLPEIRGWERKSLSLPLATGGWIHRVAQGLFLTHGIVKDWASVKRLAVSLSGWCKELWLEGVRVPTDSSTVILACLEGYLNEARTRGLDLGLQMDGSVAEEAVAERVIEEQGALLEAFGWAFLRVRLPQLLEEYELVDVEREETSLLSADVGLQGRCDAVLRRRSDQRLFIYNLKTSSNPSDKRWQDHWQVDQQLMTETLAVERRLNERVYGVIIDGFDKGQRVRMDYHTFKEVRQPKTYSPQFAHHYVSHEQALAYEGQRSRLIYGYKCEETVPGRPTLYDYEGTTRKGWEKFAVWQEQFCHQAPTTAVQHWIEWLPQEQVEASFVTLPPIMREDRKLEAMVRQMVATERGIRKNRELVEQCAMPNSNQYNEYLDITSPQNFHSCHYPSKCWAYAICHEDVNPEQDDRFVPRKANHPVEGE